MQSIRNEGFFGQVHTKKLPALVWVPQLAVRVEYTPVTLVSDSQLAIAQLLGMKAKSVPGAQQGVMRGVAWTLVLSGVVVRVSWVPSKYQPADPMSHLRGDFGGDKLRAEQMAWLIYRQLLRDTSKVEFRVVPFLGRCMDI